MHFRITPKRRALFARLHAQSIKRWAIAAKAIRAGKPLDEVSRLSELTVKTLRTRFKIRHIDSSVVIGDSRREEGREWIRLTKLAADYDLSVNAVRCAVYQKNIPRRKLVWEDGHLKLFIDKQAFEESYRAGENRRKNLTAPTIRKVVQNIEEQWQTYRFPEVSELAWVAYITLGLWKLKLFGHDPSLVQLCLAMGLGLGKLARVKNVYRDLESAGHIKRLPVRGRQRTYLWVITTPADLVPPQIAFISCSSGRHPLPWYQPNGNGTSH